MERDGCDLSWGLKIHITRIDTNYTNSFDLNDIFGVKDLIRVIRFNSSNLNPAFGLYIYQSVLSGQQFAVWLV